MMETDDSPIMFLQGDKKLLLFKLLWRMGWTRCPENCADSDDCDCAVPQEYIDTYGAKYMLDSSGVLNAASRFISDDTTDDEYLEILQIIQDPGVAGEMFTSAAPYDPTFWPLHGEFASFAQVVSGLESVSTCTSLLCFSLLLVDHARFHMHTLFAVLFVLYFFASRFD